MDSSASSKRKLLPFVPDVPYHIQFVFMLTFYYIWSRALQDNYLEDLDKLTETERNEIHVSEFPAVFNHSVFGFLEKRLVAGNIFVFSLLVHIFIPTTTKYGLLRASPTSLARNQYDFPHLFLLRDRHAQPQAQIRAWPTRLPRHPAQSGRHQGSTYIR